MGDRKESKFIESTTWVLAQNIFSMIVSLVIGSLSARYLGPSNYGLLNYGNSIISFFLSLSSLGISSILVVEMIKKPEKQGAYIGTSIFLRFITSLISFILIWMIVRMLEPGNRLLMTITLLQSTILFFNIYEILLCWFQMKLTMKYVSIATMVSLVLTGAWKIFLLATNQSVELFALNSSVSSLVTGIIVFLYFMRDAHPKMTVDLEAGRHLFENSRHFMISDIAILIYTQLDRIMLGKLVSAEATGLYSSASAIAYMWQFVPYALINSARPILLEKLQKDKEEFNRNYKVLLLGITVVCVMFSLGIMAFGKMIIMILYGPQYIEANTSLWVLVWASTFAMIGTARSIWIVGNDLNRFVTFYTVCGAITNIVLNFILIPLLGINGAALSTLASQFVVAMVAPTFIKETREFIHIYLGSFSSYKELIGITKETARKLLNRKKEYE